MPDLSVGDAAARLREVAPLLFEDHAAGAAVMFLLGIEDEVFVREGVIVALRLLPRRDVRFEACGQTVFLSAHPTIWASFMNMGDEGRPKQRSSTNDLSKGCQLSDWMPRRV